MSVEITEFHTRHFNKRPENCEPDCIILHTTNGRSARETLDWFEQMESITSCHFLIDKDGTVYECVPTELRAWHTGISSLFGVDNVDDYSIGIFLVGPVADDPFPELQISALLVLCEQLCFEFNIPLNRIVGRCHVAPYKSMDPGNDFPWFEFLNTLGTSLT